MTQKETTKAARMCPRCGADSAGDIPGDDAGKKEKKNKK